MFIVIQKPNSNKVFLSYLAPKTFKIIWLSNLWTLGYSRNAVWATKFDIYVFIKYLYWWTKISTEGIIHPVVSACVLDIFTFEIYRF